MTAKLASTREKVLTQLSRGRPACAFYGFAGPIGTLFIDTRKNTCVLVGTHKQCFMIEKRLGKPCWEHCPLNNETNNATLRSQNWQEMRFAPIELVPEDAWSGIRLRCWMEIITQHGESKK